MDLFKDIKLDDPKVFASAWEALSRIDSKTDLSTLKFLVFSSIVEVYKDDLIVDTTGKMNIDKVTRSKLVASPFSPYLRAAHFLKELKDHNSKAWLREVARLHDMHVSGRILAFPKRHFKELTHRLANLSDLYRNLEYAEKRLHRISELSDMCESQRAFLLLRKAGSLAIDLGHVFKDSFDKMADTTNQKLDLASDQAEKDEHLEEARRFESVLNVCAHDVLTVSDNLGFDLLPETRIVLKNRTNSYVQAMIDENSQNRLLDELAPEIESRLDELRAIDMPYNLTNKQFRERHPELITLAKQFTDSLPDSSSDPLSRESARALVGLMLGVYWERTGKNSNAANTAQLYLDDASRQREILQELDYLEFPQEKGQILKLVNLLDEIIDTGIFDNRLQHPELNVYEDFIIGYILAKDGVVDSKNDTNAELVNPILDVPNIPVETIAQAEYEDIKVFPPSTGSGEITEDYIRNIDSKDLPQIEWERIQRLVELRNTFSNQGLEVKLMRTKHASWQVLPFFVLEVSLPGSQRSVALVESPVYGNATYVYREAADRLPWRDVVQLERKEARELGAEPAVHVDSNKLEIHFNKLWNRVISDLTINQ